jgi:tetratricopeptide (TPR) repeat protein
MAMRALLCALILTGITPASIRANSECKAADELLDSAPPKLAQADAAYQAILKTSPSSTCATAGHTAAKNLLAAEQLDRNGLAADVSSLITDAIKARPGTPIPDSLLPPARAARAYKTAIALNRAGYHEVAVTTVQDALKAYPDYPPDRVVDPKEAKLLNDIRPSHRPFWQAEIWQNLQDVLTVILILAVAIPLAALLIWRSIQWLLRLIRHRRLLILPFDTAGPSTAGSGADAPASLGGKGFAAVVGDYIHRLGSMEGVEGPDRVSKWGDPFTFPTDLSAAVSQINLVNALLTILRRLMPSRDRSLGGLLHSDQTGTVGVSVTLENRSGHIIDDHPIWSGDFGLSRSTALASAAPARGRTPPSDRPELLYPLAYPVAVWAFWKLVKHPDRLGTKDWQSYALFGIGEEFDSLGQSDEAERSYLEALALDPDNVPAQINLANLLLKGP